MNEYYTYLDVLDRLRSEDAHKSAPSEVVRAQPLPSRLSLSLVHDASIEPIKVWLGSLFGPRYIEDKFSIALETTSGGAPRFLPIDIERLDGEDDARPRMRLRPTLTMGSAVVYHAEYELGEIEPLTDLPPVLTFHSFKGGMGRTTLALALASALTTTNRRVLFIDADFEAPGISSLLKHVIPSPRIAFSDLLTIAYASSDPEALDAIEIVSSRLSDQEIENLIVLPCTRDLGLPNISPDALTLSIKRSPFFVGSLIAKLGKAVSADLVLIDLRAGLSEVVSSLFLDPRLEHALVTTLNGQAIDGTIMLLERMREMSAKWLTISTQFTPTLPTVIINQVPPGTGIEGAGNEVALAAMNILEDELNLFSSYSSINSHLSAAAANPFQDILITTSIVESEASVAILPRDLREAQRALLRTTIPNQMNSVFGSLISLTQPAIEGESSNEIRRVQLEGYARESIFAESKPQADIFPTASLLNLVTRHQNTLPTVAVIGEKGSGKSYTFMSLALANTWGSFAERLGMDNARTGSTANAKILPVTPSQDLDSDAREAERAVTLEAANFFSGGAPLSDQSLADVISQQLRSPDGSNVVAWRDFWLDLIAWRAGFNPGQAGAFKTLGKQISDGKSFVAIFDGIETLFSRLRTSESEQAAVEALLRLVPDWLSQIPLRNVGCVIFIREDLARFALINNFKQFEDRYAAFALRWNWAEASALALWIAQQAGSLPKTAKPEDLVKLDEESRSKALVDLWGWKMGPNTSREARSLEWTMSSLSDFNRRIKARDLVRFIAEAAKRSNTHEKSYDDRLLIPRAMRDAIAPCSTERVFETGEENSDLKRIFQKVKDLTGSQRELPWSYERAHEIFGPEDVRTLEANGVLFRYEDEFFVPELYRDGLNLFYSGGARRKVVTLMRQVSGRSR